VSPLAVSILTSVGISRYGLVTGPGEWRWRYSARENFYPPTVRLARGPIQVLRTNLTIPPAAQRIFLYVCLAKMYFMDH